MKLRGKWVTVNSITRFVRDPAPVKLRSHDVVEKKLPRIGRPPRAPEPPADWQVRIANPARERIDWDSEPNYLRLGHLVDHNRLLARRAAGDYDRPVLTPYALGLLAAHESPGDLAVNPLPTGCRMTRVPVEDSSFIHFYLLGSATAAGNPSRPCDHSGIFQPTRTIVI